MNHTNLIIAAKPHIDLNIFHRQNGRTYTIGETNSISGQGSHGVSDVFGSALWLVDYCLYLAAQVFSPVESTNPTPYQG
jgi:putative heme degradation protein